MGKILVIEDSREHALIIRRVLVDAGFEVMCAEDGYIGMKMLHAEKADLVLTEIVMPNKEEIELIMELKTSFPQIKIIAMSGNEDYLRAAETFNIEHTLKKPFIDEILVKAISKALGKI